MCPSNPVVSIDPLLAVPAWPRRSTARRDRTVAVSPIVAGAALKGPADRLLVEMGFESSVVGVARWYARLVSTLVIDEADAGLAAAVEAEGVRCVVAPTIMSDVARSAALAQVVLDAFVLTRRPPGPGSGWRPRAPLVVIPVIGIGEVRPGDDLAEVLAEVLSAPATAADRHPLGGRR